MDDFIYAETDPAELADYREQAETWMNENMPRRDPVNPWHPTRDDDEKCSRNRELQRRLSDGGYAAVCYPKEYGGRSLTIAHQRIVNDVSMDFDMPILFSIPTMSICGPVILEFGTEEQKQRYIPGWIRGDELWVQFMSEPSGGSDMAGALTRADRDGDEFVINGSKIWSTFAQRSDYALMLARTNWEVPKHRGLTMFIVPIHHPGIEIHPIQMVDRTEEFCQEYFNDVIISADNVVGAVDDGWTVASRLLFHERAAVGNASPYTQGRNRNRTADGIEDLAAIARQHGGADMGSHRQRLGRMETFSQLEALLSDRVVKGIESGYFPAPAGSLVRLFHGLSRTERQTVAMELRGDQALVWNQGEPTGVFGVEFVQRQQACIGGGTTEMARNIISERILGMPREPAVDRDLPFNQVPRSG
ncbi:acyl-CoA dehydrogenase family protein [Candidatus Poriferisocius sp.]|uniref:acyl-CoA dehydrogenase family protein n=1 Tax=Candidatus Poriferisocius sp. TaxID=3101276 RepID=UPI003B011577